MFYLNGKLTRPKRNTPKRNVKDTTGDKIIWAQLLKPEPPAQAIAAPKIELPQPRDRSGSNEL